MGAAAVFAVLAVACSFNYGTLDETEAVERPGLIMNDVEYVRVRDGEPIVRVQAEQVERYERSQTMKIRNFRFEQYGRDGEKAEAVGQAGAASVELESGDTKLSDGVEIVIESEDLVIETNSLSWRDADRLLVGESDEKVLLKRKDGAVLSGQGFMSDARRHSWEFSGPVSGTYIDDKDDKDKNKEGAAP